uniref:tRNA-intron lyase n=1 Tax=Bionectria ochroleuca TaxID=29856 RepID=A0A8H7N6T3_BIOOC
MDNFGVTPTSSRDLIPADVDREFEVSDTPEGPLARYLQDGGYHTTPGLRFGSEYSVYPGDPLRFHAHFMANQYDWDEEIPILDIIEEVGSPRPSRRPLSSPGAILPRARRRRT